SVFTKKTQRLAEERKVIERLEPYVDVVESYEADPVATVQALADQHGYDLVPRGTARGHGNGQPAAAATPPDEIAEFRQALGPEMEYLAEPLAPALTKLIDRKV